jgi:hypothetical protein
MNLSITVSGWAYQLYNALPHAGDKVLAKEYKTPVILVTGLTDTNLTTTGTTDTIEGSGQHCPHQHHNIPTVGIPTVRRAHVSSLIYRWKGDYFCEADIVGALTLDKPWSAWLATGGNPDAEPGDEVLDEIADYFNISRHNITQVETEGFPVRLRTTDMEAQLVFCVTCLNWFSIPN